MRVYLFSAPPDAPAGIILFPQFGRRMACGIAGILDVHTPCSAPTTGDARALAEAVEALTPGGLPELARSVGPGALASALAAALDAPALGRVEFAVEGLRTGPSFAALVREEARRAHIGAVAAELAAFVAEQDRRAAQLAETLDSAQLEALNRWMTRLKDAAWALERDVLATADGVRALAGGAPLDDLRIRELHKLETTLAALDRLEIRGRDSLGMSVIVTYDQVQWRALRERLAVIEDEVMERTITRFASGEIEHRQPEGDRPGTIVIGWRVAEEIGKLGDNVAALRAQMTDDRVLAAILGGPFTDLTAASHTRWASNGIINQPNAHPVDNRTVGAASANGDGYQAPDATIHVVLNGDIDNYEPLRRDFEARTGRSIEPQVTTDAKIISLEIERHYVDCGDLREAFRRAVDSFEGSAAIAMHSDLAPGRIYLSLKGTGQALYVGLLDDGGYVYASEVYGLVGLTDRYLQLDGEDGGQLVELDAHGRGGVRGVRACKHDGTDLPVTDADVKTAQITTRDIDRESFEHYFLKEIHQAPDSVDKTLRGKFTVGSDQPPKFNLGEEILPAALLARLADGSIRRIFCVGQGTAAVAAAAAAELLDRALRGSRIAVQAMRASDLSGFHLRADLSHVLVIAVSQSGTTTDTNRALELVIARGAATLAIVNRRDSAITEMVDGVFYTSDGRDVEMSVASTKAFYSQVAAGAVLSQALAAHLGTQDERRIADQLMQLRRLPALLREVLGRADHIREVAAEAVRHRHWAVVGSGPNFVAAHEVRIKLSELCYKSIACDVVEDKKHIDLSSEPLILVLAAGNPEAVLGDVVKDVAIFKAHKATPVVFVADEYADDFAPYAAQIIRLPAAGARQSLILNTLAGHLYGYYAARAIDALSRPLAQARVALVDALTAHGDAYDVMTDDGVQRALRELGREVLGRLRAGDYDAALDTPTAAELALLFGQLDRDLNRRPDDPGAWLQHVIDVLSRAIDALTRPVDAIKHQAKTVTVGTSRSEKLPAGPLFGAAAEVGLTRASFHLDDVASLRRLQRALTAVPGAVRYVVRGLPSDGTPDDRTTIEPVAKSGIAARMASRAEGGAPLAGTKRTIVRTQRIHVGVGSADGRRILIAPTYDAQERLDGLLLCHVEFAETLDVSTKIDVLGVRYEDLKNAVVEANTAWDDALLEPLSPEELLVHRPDDLARRIVEGSGGVVQ